MKDQSKTKAQLKEEIKALATRVGELELREKEGRRKKERLKHAHQQLEVLKDELGRKNESLVQALDEIVYEHNLPEDRISWVGAFTKLLGYSALEMGKDSDGWLSKVHPEDIQAVVSEFEQAKSNRRLYDLEYRVRCRNGSYKWMHDRGVMHFNKEEELQQVIGIMRDITQDKRAEAALQKSQEMLEREVEERTSELLRTNMHLKEEIAEHRQAEAELEKTRALLMAAIESSPAGIIIADAPDVTIHLANSAALGIRGTTNEPLTKIPFDLHPKTWQTYHPDGTPFTGEELPLSQAVLHGKKSTNVDVIIRRETGEERWVLGNAAPVYDANGHIIAGVVVFPDITERKRIEKVLQQREQELQQVQKMEAIGTLAGGIAHDFNNILSAILGYTELALTKIHKQSEQQIYLEQVLTAASRAKELVKQILAFSRKMDPKRQPIQLDVLLKETLNLLRATIPSTIDMREQIATKSGVIYADPTQIHQVIINLCTNAEYAMRKNGGVLEIRLEMIEVTEELISAHPQLRAGPHLRLTVQDTGQGMSPEIQARVFEPFFTTKGVGEGTGMGLAVVHGIVASHGGAIAVQSKLGLGTTFVIYFPHLDTKVTREAQEDALLEKGKGCVLLVEDEETLARLAGDILVQLGYTVEVHTRSLNALESFKRSPQKYDVVISDQTMPTLTGEGLARELLHIRPNLPVVLCTGYSHTMTPEKAKAMGVQAYLMKPLQMRDLATTLHRVLRAGPERQA